MKVFTMMMSILLMLSIGASAKTLKLFDEEEDFCGKLVDGTKAEVEKTDVFAGKIALKVGPNGQSVAPSIDGWDIKFGNGEGDYKFIMFAWKKKGGNQMQMQFFGELISRAPNEAGSIQAENILERPQKKAF